MIYASINTRFDAALRMMRVVVTYTGAKVTNDTLTDFLTRIAAIYTMKLPFVVLYDARLLRAMSPKLILRQQKHMHQLEKDTSMLRFAVLSPKGRRFIVSKMTRSQKAHRVFSHDTPIEDINLFLLVSAP